MTQWMYGKELATDFPVINLPALETTCFLCEHYYTLLLYVIPYYISH